jgi:hypothetical protein
MLTILADTMLIASGFYTPAKQEWDEPHRPSRLSRLFRGVRADTRRNG